MRDFSKIMVGQTVIVECDSGLGSGGPEVVSNITTRYDEKTGVPYKVIWCGSHGFDARNGWAITPPTAYYLD